MNSSAEQKLIEALEFIKSGVVQGTIKSKPIATFSLEDTDAKVRSLYEYVDDLIPIARSLLTELAELREKAKRYDEMMIAQKDKP